MRDRTGKTWAAVSPKIRFTATILGLATLLVSVQAHSNSLTKKLNVTLAGGMDPTVAKCVDLVSLPPNPQVDSLNLDLVAIIREQLGQALLQNARGNAWMDGYHSSSAFHANLEREIEEVKELGEFFQIFSEEFEQAVHADPYLAVQYIRDHVAGRNSTNPYRDANFAYNLQKFEGGNRSQFFLLTVRYHAHHFYYVFTETPSLVLKDSSKRWGYLNDADFSKIGRVLTNTRYGSKSQILGDVSDQSKGLIFKSSLGIEYRFWRPRDSVVVGPKYLIESVELNNRLLIDPR